MIRRLADYGFVLVLVFLVFWFCEDLLIHGEVPFFRDLTNYFYPLRYSLYECYRTGESCLWDRRFAQGFPNLAAFQSGAFYPPHFVFFFLSFFASIRALFVFHFLVAALGTYGLLRSWDYSRDLCVVGAVLFTLGGTVVSLTNLLNHFQSAVWLPWFVLVWERAILTPTWSRFVLLAFVAALQFLAGSPEIFAMSMGVALLDGFRLRASHPEISIHRVLAVALGASLLMLALTAAQVLPTAELVLDSRRGQAIPIAEAFMWSLKPGSLANLFFPDKEVELNVSTGLRLFFSREVPLLVSGYLGAIGLFGLALWAHYATRRERIFLTALALASLALALGDNSLVYPFLFKIVPLISAVRFPEKYFFVTYALLIFMSMKGLRSFMLDQTKKSAIPLIVLALICAMWVGGYFYLRSHAEIVSDLIAATSNIPPLSDIHARATVSVLTNLQQQVILSLGLFFLLLLVKLDKIRPTLFSILLVSVVYVDLAWAHRDLLFSLKPERVFGSTPVINPDDARGLRLFYYPSQRDLHPAYYSVMGRPTFEQAVSLSFQNYLPNVGVLRGVDYFQEIDALNRRPYSEFLSVANVMDFARQIRLLRTFNVGYVVSFRELAQTGVRLIGHFPEYFSWLYRVEGTVPRVYLVNKFSVEKEAAKVLQRLSDPDFDPLKEVILDIGVSVKAFGELDAQATIERYENSVVSIRATANAPAILVLADAYYPGWKAFLDGRETKIFKANHFFRAVALPKGKHQVEFRYEPRSFTIGWIVSAFSLLSVILVSVQVFLKERKFAFLGGYRPGEVLREQHLS